MFKSLKLLKHLNTFAQYSQFSFIEMGVIQKYIWFHMTLQFHVVFMIFLSVMLHLAIWYKSNSSSSVNSLIKINIIKLYKKSFKLKFT